MSVKLLGYEFERTPAVEALLWNGALTRIGEGALASALSDGLKGDQAIMRALAIERERAHELAVAKEDGPEARVQSLRLHAARVERQAARLLCRAKGASEDVGGE